MSNLTGPKTIDQFGAILTGQQVPVKATTQIWQGAMVGLLSSYAVPGGTSSSGPVQGVAQASALGLASDGLINVNLLCGLFSIALDGTHAPTIANVGFPVYASSDNTVSSAAADGPMAGVLVGFEATTGKALVYIHPATNAALTDEFAGVAITGALSTVADAPAKAVLTSIIAALVARGATNSTT